MPREPPRARRKDGGPAPEAAGREGELLPRPLGRGDRGVPGARLLLPDHVREGIPVPGLRGPGRLRPDRPRRIAKEARLRTLESLPLPRDAELRKPHLRSLRLP